MIKKGQYLKQSDNKGAGKIKKLGTRIFILFFFTFFLFSCNGEVKESTSGLIKVEKTSFFIDIPSGWEIIKNTESILPKTKNSKIELVVTSKNIVNGFSNNLLVLSEDLKSFTTSKDFSIISNIGAQKDYIDYKKIESKDITFLDKENSLLYIFDAKYNLETPKLKFLQTARICKQNKAFFLTIAIPTSIKDTSKYEYLLSTFTCK